MSHTHIHVHTRDYGTPEGAKKRITGGTHGEQGPDIKAGSNTRQPNPKPEPEPFRGYDTKECDCDTHDRTYGHRMLEHIRDYGTSAGAQKRWSGSRAMNTPEAHQQRAARRERGENIAARKTSMQRQGKIPASATGGKATHQMTPQQKQRINTYVQSNTPPKRRGAQSPERR